MAFKEFAKILVGLSVQDVEKAIQAGVFIEVKS